MPIKEIMSIAGVALGILIVSHPLTWKAEVRKIQIAILRDISDTRSWGSPSIFSAEFYKNKKPVRSGPLSKH